jgi:opacity protein-like surface antigen
MAAMNRFASLLVFSVFAAASPAGAADLPSQAQGAPPLFAADPATQTPTPDWSGFYIGAGADDVFGGYDHRFDNNVILGVRFSTGYSPWIFANGPYRGFSFGEADMKLGYAMGRLTPYVVVGAALARPSYGADFGDLSQSVNSLFSGPGAVQAVGTAGVGVDYALTNNITVGVEARVNNGGPFGGFDPLH